MTTQTLVIPVTAKFPLEAAKRSTLAARRSDALRWMQMKGTEKALFTYGWDGILTEILRADRENDEYDRIATGA